MTSANVGEAEKFNRILSNKIPDVLQELYGQSYPTQDGDYLLGDVSGKPGKSLKLTYSGQYKGRWKDWAVEGAEDRAKDMLDLIAHAKGFSGERAISDAMRWARDRFLVESEEVSTAAPPPPRNPSPTNTQAPETREPARRLWESGESIAGTLGETYLRSRGLIREDGNTLIPDNARFHPGIHAPKKSEVSGEIPAILLRAEMPDGSFGGIQRVYLQADGQAKHAHLKACSLGTSPGAVAKIANDPGRVHVAEGFEDAATMYLAEGGSSWVAFGSNRIPTIELTVNSREVVICLDRDDASFSNCRKLLARLHAAGNDASVKVPEVAKDFNDILQGKAAA
jgi:hypothetical protein